MPFHARSVRKIFVAGLVSVVGFSTTTYAAAPQDYPVKPIKLVVPFSPGGTSDLLGRLVADKLGTALGETVIVENRPGAGSMIGTGHVAKAAPDGYTLLLATSSSLVVSPAFTKAPYDPITDFAPVAVLAVSPLALVVSPSLGVNSVQELTALAKSKPGTLNMASFGNGSSSHLTGELFKSAADVDMVHVAYNGSSAAMVDLMAGRVEVMFDMVAAALPHQKAGKVRVLATTGSERAGAMPDTPTVAEAVPGYESSAWFGVVAPAGTPKPIIDRLNAELLKAVKEPEIKKLLTEQSFSSLASTPDEFTDLIKRDLAKWTGVVKDAGITP